MSDPVPVIPGVVPPPSYDDGEDKPLASIPLSQLMQSVPICVLCGSPLPLETKEVALDGGIYQCCKVCPARHAIRKAKV